MGRYLPIQGRRVTFRALFVVMAGAIQLNFWLESAMFSQFGALAQAFPCRPAGLREGQTATRWPLA